MRRFPISWDKTLTSLGFRRNVKRVKRSRYGRKSSRLEQLEVRAMLSASPNEVLGTTDIADFTATALAQQYSLATIRAEDVSTEVAAGDTPDQFVVTTEQAEIGSPIAPIRAEYVLADATAGDTPDQFEVTTEYAKNGSPTAVVRLKEGFERIDKSLQELTVELRLGDSVLARHEVLIDIADAKFVHDFQRAREAEFKAEINAPGTSDDIESRDWLSKIDADGRFTDLSAGSVSVAKLSYPESLVQGPTLNREVPGGSRAVAPSDALERIATIGRRQEASVDLLRSDAEKTNYYRGLEKSLADAPKRGVSTDIEAVERSEKLANELAVRLGRQIAQDVKSGDAGVAAAAVKARAELLKTADPSYTVLTGLKANHHLASNDNGRGQTGYSLNIVEEGSITIGDAVRVELGDYEAMVQTRSEWGRSSSKSSILAPLLADVGTAQDANINPGSPNTNYDTNVLSVIDYHSSYYTYVSSSLIGFDLSQYAGSVPESATLTLDTVSGSGDAISVAAHRDLWNTDPAAEWDESTVTWNEYATDLQSGFGPALDTQTATAGSTLSLDVTETIQRALLLGDSNFSSDLDWRGAAGDVEAFYLAATDYAAYSAKYAGLEHASVVDGFLYRNDANVDGVVDSDDVAPYLQRMGIARGDFNLDGTVDGKDYAVWSANFGVSAERFGMGDANADTYVNQADYTVWQDSFGETVESSTTPEATFHLTTTNGSASFASSETTTGVAPKLTVDLASRTVVQSFDTTGGDLRVTYENQHESPTAPTLAIYQVVDEVRTPLATGVALSTAIGVHQAIVTAPAAITNPGEAYSLIAEIETSGVATTWREFDGGVFETADGKVHAHGTAGDDTIGYDEGVFSVSNASGFTADHAVGSTGGGAYVELGGLVSFEAEDYHAKLVGATDDWSIASDQTGHTGSGFVYAGPDDGSLYGTSPGYLNGSPRLDYQVEFASAGTYYVWVRGMKADGSSDSVHVGLDGQANTTADRTQILGTGFNWNRNRVGGGIATLVVPSAGVHTVNIWMREDGVRIDKLIVTDDANYTPTGDGPAVSTGGPSSGTPFTGEAYLHGLAGADTLLIAEHTGAHVSLAGGVGDDLYHLFGEATEASAVTIHDDSGLDQLWLDSWDPSALVDLNSTSTQLLTAASGALSSVALTLSQASVEYTAAANYAITSGDGYTSPLTVTSLDDVVDGVYEGEASRSGFTGELTLREALTWSAAIDPAISNDPVEVRFADWLVDGDKQAIALSHVGAVPGQIAPLRSASTTTISGPGADKLVIDAQGESHAIESVVAGRVLRIEGVTVTGASGTGIYVNSGTLHLEGVEVVGNQGGGVDVSSSQLFVIDSAIVGNTGYGIRVQDSPLVQIENTTVSSNAGTGIVNYGSDASIVHATVYDNATIGLYTDYGGTTVLHNSIAFESTINPQATGLAVGNSGSIDTSSSYNLVGQTSGTVVLSGNGNLTSEPSAGLSPLGVYGGPTRTHAVEVGSPAFDNGNPASSATSDQRGFDRVGTVDIGAYEVQDAYIWREAENYAWIGTNSPTTTAPKLDVIGDPTASGGRLVSYFPDVTEAGGPSAYTTFENDRTAYTIPVHKPGNYSIWARVIAPASSSDSGTTYSSDRIEFSIDGGQEVPWTLDPANRTDWEWVKYSLPQTLAVGERELVIRHIDPSVQLDKIVLTSDPTFDPNLPNDNPHTEDLDLYDTQTISLSATVRDFNGLQPGDVGGIIEGVTLHPDFQNQPQARQGATLGLASLELNDNQKPTILSRTGFNPSGSPNAKEQFVEASELSETDPNNFNFWFTDNPSYNSAALAELHLIEDANEPGVYQFYGSTVGGVTAGTHEFYPIDGLLLSDIEQDQSDNDGQDRQYNAITDDHSAYFTLELHAEFTYDASSQQYLDVFKSDDDLWVYVDGVLWVDNGGVHNPMGTEVDFVDDYANEGVSGKDPSWSTRLVDGETYSFDLFYAQRHRFDSHLAFATNIELREPESSSTLEEGTRLVTEPDQRYRVQPGAAGVEVRFSDLTFDFTGGNPADFNDAFEVAVIDRSGEPARVGDGAQATLGTIAPSSDALFNITQGQSPLMGSGVELLDASGVAITDPIALANVTEGTVRINLDGRDPSKVYDVVIRLVNNDGDNTTRVTLPSSPVTTLTQAPTISSQAILAPANARSADVSLPGLSYSNLEDVTGSFDLKHQLSTFDEDADGEEGISQLVTRLELTKQPGLQVRRELLLAIKPPTDQVSGGFEGTKLVNQDWTLPWEVAGLPAGTPFIRLTNLMDTQDRFYVDGASLGEIELVFEHDGNERFDFEYVLLGELNDPPSFTSDPYATQRGAAYPVEFQTNATATPVPMLEIVAARNGEFRYTPTMIDPNGDHTRVEIVTGPVTDTTDPDSIHNLRVIDTNEDGRNDTVVWTPRDAATAGDDLGIHTITLRTIDEHDGYTSVNDQTFKLRVVTDALNRPPQFTKPPKTLATFGSDYDYDADAVDPESHDLVYTGVLGGKPQSYELAIANDLSSGVSAGDTLTHLTFINDAPTGGVGMYQNVLLYEADWPADPVALKFDHGRFVDYGTGGNATRIEVVGDLSVLRLDGDLRAVYKLSSAYTVTEHTRLAFTFSSDSPATEGEAHGVGVETDAFDPLTSPVNNSRWQAVYGSTVPSGDDRYDPAWSIDQTTNFTIDGTTGDVRWTDIPREAIDKWVHVELTATETDSTEAIAGNPLFATQPYELLVQDNGIPPIQEGEVDLVIGGFDTTSLHIDGQTLEIGGVITANVANLGAGVVNGPFTVTFFEDLDFNGEYDPVRDNRLGDATVENTVVGGGSLETEGGFVTVSAPLSGQVLFGGPAVDNEGLSGSQIVAFVDSGHSVSESEEGNNYAGSHDDCLATPHDESIFEIEHDRTLLSSQPGGTNVWSTPLVININDDPRPEIVYVGDDHFVTAYDLVNDVELWRYEVDAEQVIEIAAADIDNDGAIEIVVPGYSKVVLIQLDTSGTVISESSAPFSQHLGRAPAIGNVDDDAFAEIVIGTTVFEHDLTRKPQPNLVTTSIGSNHFGPISLIADIDGDGIGDIVAGNTAIKSDGTPIFGPAPGTGDGFSAVADFGTFVPSGQDWSISRQRDGIPEIVLVSAGTVALLDSVTGSPIWTTSVIPELFADHEDGQGGAPTVGDIDGVLDANGNYDLEIGVAGGSEYIVFDGLDGSIRWTYTTQDFTSAATGSSLFDFNDDGKVEIVYADEANLHILGVPDDQSSNQLVERVDSIKLGSGTAYEIPVIANVDDDPAAEIVVVSNSYLPGSTLGPYGRGVHVFGHPDDAWLPTRAIWNQNSYHITNILDDDPDTPENEYGRVPITENLSWLNSNTYRLNAFPDAELNAFIAPDLVSSSLRTIDIAEGEQLLIRVGNAGSLFAPEGVVVRFYDGDPIPGNEIGSKATSVPLEPGEYEDVSISIGDGPIDLANVTVVVDPDDEIRECREDNNSYTIASGTRLNVSPEFDYDPLTVVSEGQVYEDRAFASDAPDDDTLWYDLLVAPDGMGINNLTGDIDWDPTSQQILQRSHFVSVYVEDGYGGSDTKDYRITTQFNNEDPEITPIDDRAVGEGTVLTIPINVFDPNVGDLLYDELFVLTPLPVGVGEPTLLPASVDPNEPPAWEFAWDTSGVPEGVYSFNVLFEDGRTGSDAESFSIFVYDDNTPPEFKSDDPGIDPVVEGVPWLLSVYTSDTPDGDSRDPDPPAGYLVDIDEVSKARGLVYNQATGTLSWPDPDKGAPAFVVFTATDSEGLTGPTWNLTLPVNVRQTPIGDNDPARFDGEPQLSNAKVGRPWFFRTQAIDLDGDDVTINVESFVDANGVPISEGTGPGEYTAIRTGGTSGQAATFSIIWEPPVGTVGPVTLIVSARDDNPGNNLPGESYDAYQLFNVPVIENREPFVTRYTNEAEVPVGQLKILEFEIVDLEGDQVYVELLTPIAGETGFYDSNENLITGRFTASFDPAAPTAFELRVTPEKAGFTPLVVRITDDYGNATERTINFTAFDDSPLGWEFTAPTTAAVGVEYVGQVKAKPYGGEVEYLLLDETGEAVERLTDTTGTRGDGQTPVGMRIDPQTGRISWIPAADQLSAKDGVDDITYSYRVIIRDANSTSIATDPFGIDSLIVVSNFTNTPPTITSKTDNIRFSLTEPFVYTLTGNDPENHPITFEQLTGPGNLVGDRFTWQPTTADLNRTRTIVFQASDPYAPGGTQTVTLSLTGENEPGGPTGSPTAGNQRPEISSTAPQPGPAGVNYVYRVRATDSDGDEVELLPPAQINGVDYLWTDHLDGSATFTWVDPPANTSETFDFVVVDEHGARGEQSLTLTFDDSGGGTAVTPDTPISIDAIPPGLVAVGSLYDYKIKWTDPDGPPAFTIDAVLLEGGGANTVSDLLAGTTFNSATGEFTWMPTIDDIGILSVTVTATQGSPQTGSATDSVTYTLQVFDAESGVPNQRPRLDPATPLTATPGGLFSYPVPGSDDGPFGYYLVDESGKLVEQDGVFTIEPETGVVTWQVTADAPTDGSHFESFTVDLLDDANQRTGAPIDYTVTVTEDMVPTVVVFADRRRQEPNGEVVFTLFAEDDVAVVDRRLTISFDGGPAEEYTVGSDNRVTYQVPNDAAENSTIVATATVYDAKLQSATADATVTVREVDTQAPTVVITSETSIVLEEAFDLAARFSDADGNIVHYSVIATPTSGGQPIVLESVDVGDLDELTDPRRTGNYLTTGMDLVVHQVNPFTLPNESYDITVLVRDEAEKEGTATALYQIRSGQKLGNFALTFTDMSVPVAGIPLSVVRSYDSLDANNPSGDFGSGWSVDLVTGKLDYLSAGSGSDLNGFLFGDEPMFGGSRVTLTLPGGEEHQFTVQPVPVDTTGNGFEGFVLGRTNTWVLAFQPAPGQASRLDFISRGAPNGSGVSLGSNFYYPQDLDGGFAGTLPEDVLSQPFTGALASYLSDGSLVGSPGNPTPVNPSALNADFRLTTRNGTEYIFDSSTFELVKVTDPDDFALELRDNRYTSRAPDGTVMGELTIERVNGRITRIADEKGNELRYEYENGLLKRFFDRTNGGDTPTAEFFYGEEAYGEIGKVPDRVLTSIRNAVTPATIDGLPGRALTVGWDADGRVQRIGDASGAAATFAYTVDLRETLDDADFTGFSSEVVRDAPPEGSPMGTEGVPTELVRDARGRVVRRMQRVDDNDTDDSTNAGDDRWLVTLYEYDDEDRQVGESKPFTVKESSTGANSRYTALPPGAVEGTFTADPADTVNFDADYWVSVQKFNDRGNLVVSVDGAGLETRYEEFNEEYGFAGRVEGPNGVTITSSSIVPGGSRLQTTTQVNANGDGDNSVTQLRFDGPLLQTVSQGARDRAPQDGITGEPDTEALRQVSGLFYDRQLRLESTTDASGVATHFVYDRNDNQVLSYRVWEDPAGVEDFTIVTETVHDQENRVTGTKQYQLGHAPAAVPTITGVDSLGSFVPLWETETQYNATGQVVRSTDRNGNSSYTLYDIRGSAVESRTETVHPDPAVVAVGGLAWVVTRTAYDRNGRVVAVTDPFVVRNDKSPLEAEFNPTPDGGVTIDPTMGHDVVIKPDGNTWDDADYRLTHTLYDDLGRVRETRRVAGVPVTSARAFEATNSPGDNLYSTAFDYDKTVPDDYTAATADELAVSTTAYDTQGRVDWTASYGSDNQADTEVHTYFRYDTAGRQTEVATVYDTDNNGVTFDQDNDPEYPDQAFPQANPDVFITTTVYNQDTGRQSETIDAGGVTTSFEYDGLGRVIATIADAGGPDEIRTSQQYDHAGRRTHSTDALLQRTQYGYDPVTGRLTSVVLPAVNDDSRGSTTGQAVYEYGYDDYGNQVSITDPREGVTEFEFDHLGRQVKRTLPDSVLEETMRYDDLGRAVRSVDLEGRTVDYVYDDLGRLDARFHYDINTSPPIDIPINGNSPGQLWSGNSVGYDEAVDYVYDAMGRTIKVREDLNGDGVFTDPDDRLTDNAYDAQGRLTRVDSPEGILNYEYDDLGRQTATWTGDLEAPQLVNASTATEYAYDALGRLAEVTSVKLAGQAVGQTTAYRYDKLGNLEYVLSPGNASYYEYDSLNRLDKLTQFVDANSDNQYVGTDDREIATFDYFVRDDGKRSGVVEEFYQSDGVTVLQRNTFDWTYDEAGRLVEETLSSSESSALTGYVDQYGYDLAGNRLRYQHDSDGGTDKLVTYDYDENDRLLWEKTDSGGDGSIDESVVYTYEGSRQSRKATYATDTEDGVGEIVLNATNYTYSVRGRMSGVDTDDDSVADVTYEYNDNGFRVQKTEGTVLTMFLVDTQNHTGHAQVMEATVDDNLEQAYLIGNDVVAQGESDGTVYYLVSDGHGSTRALVNSNGQIVTPTNDSSATFTQLFAYTAYGEAHGFVEDAALTTLLYSGEWTEVSVGMQYLRARFYDPATSRFNRVDDYAGNNQDPQSLHKYLYTHADPVNGIDPSGLLASSTLTANAIGSSLTLTNLVGTYLVLGSAKTINDAYTEYIELERVADLLDVDVISEPRDATRNPRLRVFAHGSSTGFWQQATIDGRGVGDFGTGFYTFIANPKGIAAASRRATEQSRNPLNRLGSGVPFVLLVGIGVPEFSSLSKRSFGSPQSPTADYSSTVGSFNEAGGKGMVGVDVVFGPYSRGVFERGFGIDYVPNIEFPNQYKFEGDAIGRLRPIAVMSAGNFRI